MSNVLIAIDPGPEESAYVVWDGEHILSKGDEPNVVLVKWLATPALLRHAPNICAIEQVRGFGIMASDGLFDTCQWTGRFLQAFGEPRTHLIPRKMVSKYICGTSGVSHDKFIREALITRFGGKDVAIGNKAKPGILYGIAGHTWAALALGLTWWDLNVHEADCPMLADGVECTCRVAIERFVRAEKRANRGIQK